VEIMAAAVSVAGVARGGVSSGRAEGRLQATTVTSSREDTRQGSNLDIIFSLSSR
jgi:hypothetical protein